MNATNSVSEALNAGERVCGCFIPFPSPEIVEIAAHAGFDFALIDNEHGYVTAHEALPMVLAAERHGIEPFVRVGLRDRQAVLKFLDVGCTGIMSPRVESAAAAAEAIANTKYATAGERGMAVGRTFDWGQRAPLAAYVEPLNHRVMNIVQFENAAVLPLLDEMLRVPGLDVIFVGPADLAQSMGHPGQPGHPDVTAVADEVVARAHAAGVKVGTVALNRAVAETVAARGFDMIVGTAVGLLGEAMKAYVAPLRGC